jgi:hypothetical protein
MDEAIIKYSFDTAVKTRGITKNILKSFAVTIIFLLFFLYARAMEHIQTIQSLLTENYVEHGS